MNLRKDHGLQAGALEPSHVRTVLDAVAARSHPSFPVLADHPDTRGVSLRLDLSRGLTESAGEMLALAQNLGWSAWVLFPTVAGGDLGYAREGRLYLDPAAAAVLQAWRDRYRCEFGFLADPSAAISRVLNSPIDVWKDVQGQLEKHGIRVTGLGCSFHRHAGAVLDMTWAYRAAGLLTNTDWLTLLRRVGYESREWLYERSDAGAPELRVPKDGVESITLHVHDTADVEYLPSLLETVRGRVGRTLKPALDVVVYSEKRGWVVATKRGAEQAMSTPELCSFLREQRPNLRAAIIIDPSDMCWPACVPLVPGAKDRVLRPLPYPFHHFLSVNSDVDWSTFAHLEQASEYVSEGLGLPLSGSAYLTSSDLRWPAWQRLTDSGADRDGEAKHRLARLASSMALDTIHGVTYSFDTVYIPVPGDGPSGPMRVPLAPELVWSRYEGLLLTTSGRKHDSPDLELGLKVAGSPAARLHLPCARRIEDDAWDCTYHYYPFPEANHASEHVRAFELKVLPREPVCLQALHTVRSSPAMMEKVLHSLQSHGFCAPVMTAHGGGEGTLRFGSLVSESWATAHPAEARLALDRPASPYYCYPTFRAAGVHFLSGNGNRFNVFKLCPLSELLSEEHTQDGQAVLAFSRYYSNRYTETNASMFWTYGKHGATAQGLATNLEDILQQFHWLPLGHGTILYTHLGHRIGNQLAPRLGWNEETLAAWKRLAVFYLGSSASAAVPYRLWLAPASAILTWAAVMRHLPKSIRVDDNEVHISSWLDPALGFQIPDAGRFGTSWLHGITIHLPDPHEADVWVDDFRVQHFTCNPADTVGGPSITLVDESRKVPFLHDVPEAHTCGLEVRLPNPGLAAPLVIARTASAPTGPSRIPIPPLSLRNATHWTFELSLDRAITGWSVGLEMEHGSCISAGSADEADCRLPTPKTPDWRRYTLALFDASNRGQATGRVVALRLWANSSIKLAPPAEARFRDVCLLTPTPTLPRRGRQRLLAGRVLQGPTRSPWPHVAVLCRSGEDCHRVLTSEDGYFTFTGLLDQHRYRLELETKEARQVHYFRGQTAHLTCDHWDWDIWVW